MAKKGVSKKKTTAIPAEPQSIRTIAPMKTEPVAQQPRRLHTETAPGLAPAKAAAVPASGLKQPVQFGLTRRGAQQVCLAGDFNKWSANTAPLVRQTGDSWAITVELEPGRYQYKFVVDGEWVTDPSATENAYNVHGTLNSVIEVRS